MTEETLNINGKVLYSTKGAAREYGRIGCNFYTGCPHECTYCYLKRGAPSKLLGGNEVKLKKCFKDERDAINQFWKELNKWRVQCQLDGIFLSFTTDPLIKKTRSLTLSAMNMALINDVPVYILTKNADFINDDSFMTWIERYSPLHRDFFHFGFTLTGRDDLEPKASKNADRLKAMGVMQSIGFPTFASVEPVIDWESTSNIIYDAIPTCDHFKLGLRSGVKKDYYNIAESGAAIEQIVRTVKFYEKTIYLKESTRKLLRQYFTPEAYKEFVSKTVDMDGNNYTFDND